MSITKSRKSMWLFVVIAVIGLTAIFFLTSKLFLYDGDPVMQTPFNQPINNLSDTTIILKRWEYNPEAKLMEIQFKAKNNTANPFDAKLIYYAKAKINPTKKLPVKTVYASDGDYVVQIKDIPNNFKVVGLFIKEENRWEKEMNMDFNYDGEFVSTDTQDTNYNTDNDTTVALYGDYRKIKTNHHLKTKTEKQYAFDTIENDIKLQKMQIKNIKDGIALQDGIKKELQKEIEELESEKKYQTTEEQKDTDLQIESKKQAIIDADKKQEDMKKALIAANEKLKMLYKKLHDEQQKAKKEAEK